MPVAQIGFLFRGLKGNVLSEKKLFWYKMVFLTKNHRFLKFSKCTYRHRSIDILIIKTVLQLNEPVRWDE